MKHGAMNVDMGRIGSIFDELRQYSGPFMIQITHNTNRAEEVIIGSLKKGKLHARKVTIFQWDPNTKKINSASYKNGQILGQCPIFTNFSKLY